MAIVRAKPALSRGNTDLDCDECGWGLCDVPTSMYERVAYHHLIREHGYNPNYGHTHDNQIHRQGIKLDD